MFIYQFPLLAPHHLLESQKFNILYPSPDMITQTADKLRWYRYRLGLLQRDIADIIGIDRKTYIHYEEDGKDYYPLEHMSKLAELFGVPVTELLDEYNTFLYNDQGKQLRERREALGLSRIEYAAQLGVPTGTLKKWELNGARMFKSTWERLFK